MPEYDHHLVSEDYYKDELNYQQEIDKENNIWVTDVGLHQIFKFNSDGTLLLTLGKAQVPGNDKEHFSLPTDVAVSADGSFYVSDGYGNSRVVKFSKDGTYLFEWGKFGNKQGEFNIPHGIDLDKNGNVYVADRENNRIQKFDAQGNFITLWQNQTTDQLYSVTIDNQNNHLFGIDYFIVNDTIFKGSDIFRLDLDTNLQMQFGRTGFYNGPISRYHDIAVDDEGTIYVGDILGNKIQKFQLKFKNQLTFSENLFLYSPTGFLPKDFPSGEGGDSQIARDSSRSSSGWILQLKRLQRVLSRHHQT